MTQGRSSAPGWFVALFVAFVGCVIGATAGTGVWAVVQLVRWITSK